MSNETIPVDFWKPNWKHCCIVCQQKPVVQGIHNDKVVYNGEMCGVCTWGEAAMHDPANWNR